MNVIVMPIYSGQSGPMPDGVRIFVAVFLLAFSVPLWGMAWEMRRDWMLCWLGTLCALLCMIPAIHTAYEWFWK